MGPGFESLTAYEEKMLKASSLFCLISVNEDFEAKRNVEICFLVTLFLFKS